MKSQNLQVILNFIIIIGNFLNTGHAIGIKLASLNGLKDMKTNKNGLHFLHVVAIEVQRFNPKLLNLEDELKFLEKAYRFNKFKLKILKQLKFISIT